MKSDGVSGRVLVTGGAGYIGSHTVVELASAGYEPVIVDDFSNSNRWILPRLEALVGRSLECLELDCADLSALDAALEQRGPISGVIHFAAFKAVSESVAEPLRYYDNNLGALLGVLKLMELRAIPRLVFSSSCTVYGQAARLPVTEDSPLQPATCPYGHSKVMSEQIIRDCRPAGAVLLRYFNPIGAHPSGQIGELPSGVPQNLVPYITQTAAGLRGELSIFGDDYDTPDGTCVRDYIHVCDLARAHVAALERLAREPRTTAYNVGTGAGHSVRELVSTFEQVTGASLPTRQAPRREGDVPAIYADVTKARAELGWEARYSLTDALRDAWRWERALRASEDAPVD